MFYNNTLVYNRTRYKMHFMICSNNILACYHVLINTKNLLLNNTYVNKCTLYLFNLCCMFSVKKKDNSCYCYCCFRINLCMLLNVSKHNTIMVCIVQICYCYIFRKLFGCFFSHFLTNLYIF